MCIPGPNMREVTLRENDTVCVYTWTKYMREMALRGENYTVCVYCIYLDQIYEENGTEGRMIQYVYLCSIQYLDWMDMMSMFNWTEYCSMATGLNRMAVYT